MGDWTKGVPEENGKYLVTDGKNVSIMLYEAGEGFGSRVHFKGGNYFAKRNNIIAWMNLPEPPRAGEFIGR